jgi:hypothetical protein
MGIDVYVYNNDDQIVNNKEFIENGFPSSNLRQFNIFGWIPKFDDLIGDSGFVDKNSILMTKVDKNIMQNWYNYIIQCNNQDNIMAKYIKYCIDNDYYIKFW